VVNQTHLSVSLAGLNNPTFAQRAEEKLLINSFLRILVVLVAMTFISVPARAQQTATPETVARGFYTWYLHQLTLENMNPLKQKATALRYMTPQLYANAPRLIRRMDADIFICAQDWDKGWEKNFTVSGPQIKKGSATTTVTLPSGETDKIRIDLNSFA
jgi:hypothetical protein